MPEFSKQSLERFSTAYPDLKVLFRVVDEPNYQPLIRGECYEDVNMLIYGNDGFWV